MLYKDQDIMLISKRKVKIAPNFTLPTKDEDYEAHFKIITSGKILKFIPIKFKSYYYHNIEAKKEPVKSTKLFTATKLTEEEKIKFKIKNFK